MREIRTLGAMWRGLETGSRFGYRGTPGGNGPGGNGEQRLGPTFGIPRQSSPRPLVATHAPRVPDRCQACFSAGAGLLSMRKATDKFPKFAAVLPAG